MKKVFIDGSQGTTGLKIYKRFENRNDIDYISKIVPNEQIAENNYNLSVLNYVEKEDTRENIDIVKLNKEIEKIVEKEQNLRSEIQKIISEIEVENE